MKTRECHYCSNEMKLEKAISKKYNELYHYFECSTCGARSPFNDDLLYLCNKYDRLSRKLQISR